MWEEVMLQNLDDQAPLDFWGGIAVWVERPHIINHKLSAIDVIETWSIAKKSDFDTNTITANDLIKLFLTKTELSVEQLISIFQPNFFMQSINNQEFFHAKLSQSSNSEMVLQLRKLLPKNIGKFKSVLEVIVIDYMDNSVAFYPQKSDVSCVPITPLFPYKIKLHNEGISLEIYGDVSENCASQLSLKWLKSCVLPKVRCWCQTVLNNPTISSLSLVSAEKYNEIYHYLKAKYGKKFVEMWPECTDPLKYVYEDIAIASYLMTIWEQERKMLDSKSNQTFVDVGCGNGLLVHILVSEGFKGIGVDIRKRNIWNLYGTETVLQERTVEPSDKHLFPEYDWIIGNHSDELTPWIPVIAARSSYKARVFLLPCCFYTFDGKYNRNYPGSTRYQSYLKFISHLCSCMGFNVQQDKLRIPSTKRVCFICLSRNYKESEEEVMDIQRVEYIRNNSQSSVKAQTIVNFVTPDKDFPPHSTAEQLHCLKNVETNEIVNNWITSFKPREKIPSVSNCTNLNRSLINELVLKIANILLKEENYIDLYTSEGVKKWNKGGELSIQDLAKQVEQDTKNSLKKQDGGLKTLIRNHKNIFKIENGTIKLCIPSRNDNSNALYEAASDRTRNNRRKLNRKFFKGKKCYFYYYHPQGCPLLDDECSFSHNI